MAESKEYHEFQKTSMYRMAKFMIKDKRRQTLIKEKKTTKAIDHKKAQIQTEEQKQIFKQAVKKAMETKRAKNQVKS